MGTVWKCMALLAGVAACEAVLCPPLLKVCAVKKGALHNLLGTLLQPNNTLLTQLLNKGSTTSPTTSVTVAPLEVVQRPGIIAGPGIITTSGIQTLGVQPEPVIVVPGTLTAGGMPAAPGAGGMPAAPGAGGMPAAPGAGGMPAAPDAGGMPAAPVAMPAAPDMPAAGGDMPAAGGDMPAPST